MKKESENNSEFNYAPFINALEDAFNEVLLEEYGENPPLKVDWTSVKIKASELLGLNITD